MTVTVTDLFRHPIKSHGRERLETVTLEAGRTMPGDRVWAVAHEGAKIGPAAAAWAVCGNFARGAKAPGLMALDARLDPEAGTVTLRHPVLGEITINPDVPEGAARLIEWTTPLMEGSGLRASHVVRVPGRGMTDTDYPSISINSHNSLRALSGRIGRPLSPLRFRGNIWVEAEGPWQEFEWIGRRIRIGEAELVVREPIVRCAATTANAETGERDADTLGALRAGWGHQNFGVYAEVVRPGRISCGDTLEVIA